ncbi:MAG TPA: flavodoxin domain-containing protein [Candidatus Limnocylindrales bacterium]
MNGRALVAYASKYGSTAEIAEAIATTLREEGMTTDVALARDVASVGAYDVVVVGSGVYMNRWDGAALGFLKRFERELAARPTWLFSSGPTGGSKDAEVKMAAMLAAQPPAPGEAGKRAQRIGARGHATFAGRIVPEMGGIFARWLPRGDWRDFDAVRSWARRVAADVAGEVAVGA